MNFEDILSASVAQSNCPLVERTSALLFYSNISINNLGSKKTFLVLEPGRDDLNRTWGLVNRTGVIFFFSVMHQRHRHEEKRQENLQFGCMPSSSTIGFGSSCCEAFPYGIMHAGYYGVELVTVTGH